jgi:hypothetical protein
MESWYLYFQSMILKIKRKCAQSGLEILTLGGNPGTAHRITN